MNTEELRAALEADTDGWGEPWRRHVSVLQEYVGELVEALREYEAESKHDALDDLVRDAEDMGLYEAEEPNATTKAAIEAAERGEVEEMSDEERRELGFPASRAELVDTLRELYTEHYRYYDPFSEKELFNRIRNILSREES